ncbi:DUF488 family protein [Mycolicibacterium smegmatis]|uniref:DUF488 domain-containing protein n=1 Tax=Mycolicibacterium smegmatis TaxID=1772 RepID=UPI001303EA77|nr:DUF488 family protein [Mycolicibacterium smegmatis]UGU31354.1 DUF488 family protein [Mycolicibacterium smegmatis]ULN72252.1 DUF488 family protein [Mycolicibacterium smegmatis]
MASKHEVRLARVYEEPEPGEGHRVLVDRLWPRGLRKDDPRIGQWLPEVAASTELRRWYGHAPERYDEFARRYTAELQVPPAAEALDELRDIVRAGPVVLVTATKDIELSHLSVLARLLT